MRVHHLNCAAIVFPEVPEELRPIPCHVLLCETDAGLVLIDSGFAVANYLGDGSGELAGPPEDVRFTALRQIEAMGYTADDVTDIVITHMDGDHIGGLRDFPQARVHTTADEHAAAITEHYDPADRPRYRPRDWAHHPRFELYSGPGEPWRFGLNGHEVLPGITLLPMAGHTRGHAAVAVDAGEGRVILHAGDAAFDASVHGGADAAGEPLVEIEFLRQLEQATSYDPDAVAANHEVLQRLAREPGVTVINTHDARIL
jgi:glyoxylase-like metal-dependent hydrolase (beta-lactamase superfamily II)